MSETLIDLDQLRQLAGLAADDESAPELVAFTRHEATLAKALPPEVVMALIKRIERAESAMNVTVRVLDGIHTALAAAREGRLSIASMTLRNQAMALDTLSTLFERPAP